VLHPLVEPGQFTSWVFGERIRSAGLLPSFGTVGDGLDNAMMESFWSSMQIELLNRKRWKTSNAQDLWIGSRGVREGRTFPNDLQVTE
jgi:transposase InsO family protein